MDTINYEEIIKAIGKSLFVIVPRQVRERLDIQEGDTVKVSLSKIDELINIKCKHCDTVFVASRSHSCFDCPNCGSEILLHEARVIE